MARVFVDPMIHSARLARAQWLILVSILAGIAAFLWGRWLLSEGGASVRLTLASTGLIAAAGGLGYYMQKRLRGVMKDRTWLEISDAGIRQMTPAGLVEASWDEVIEVRVGLHPSRTRMPDVIIVTPEGAINAYMRLVDRGKGLPEPSLLSPGRRFVHPGGEVREVTPWNSELVAAVKEHVPGDKIKEGVMLSL